ncbi:MAG: hypothetical protein QXR87_07575 [Candidatus Hadarchaeales archaeon]
MTECSNCTWYEGECTAAPLFPRPYHEELKEGRRRLCPFFHRVGVEYRLSGKGEEILRSLLQKWREEDRRELLLRLVEVVG